MIEPMGEIKILNSMGERVRALRVAQGMDQIQLARAVTERGAPIENATISAIERGKVNPSVPVLVAIGDVFGVSLDYLTMRTHVAETPLVSDEPVYFSPEADEVARIVDDLPQDVRLHIVEHVRLELQLQRDDMAAMLVESERRRAEAEAKLRAAAGLVSPEVMELLVGVVDSALGFESQPSGVKTGRQDARPRRSDAPGQAVSGNNGGKLGK